MYKIKNERDGSCEILLYDLITGGYSAQAIISQLKGTQATSITLRINSDGGDVFEAIAIYNYLKGTGAEINVYIDGLAASAASVVAMCGKVHMPRSSMMMLHNPWGAVQGDSGEMRAMSDVLDKVKACIADIYAAKSGLSVEKVSELMGKETWLTADEAFTLGFCDEVLEGEEPEGEEPEGQEDVEAAVNAERRRLQELDALMAPGRRGIINKAKYETFQSASDIALELLRIQARKEDNDELGGIAAVYSGSYSVINAAAEAAAEKINRKRGYKNGR